MVTWKIEWKGKKKWKRKKKEKERRQIKYLSINEKTRHLFYNESSLRALSFLFSNDTFYACILCTFHTLSSLSLRVLLKSDSLCPCKGSDGALQFASVPRVSPMNGLRRRQSGVPRTNERRKRRFNTITYDSLTIIVNNVIIP